MADSGGGGALDLFDQPADPQVWTVSDLNRRVKRILEGSFQELWVTGEVTNWTRARSGHCYFSLKDETAQLRCVMWRNAAARLPMDPDEGIQVRAQGSLTLYEARGEYQLSVRSLELEGGEGLWRLAFERLRRKLLEEGLLDPARKRPLPRFPRTVGVVTSPTGAAVRDILRVLGRRAPWTRVLFRGARVQGEGASEEIAGALDALGRSGRCDLIIVGRGGGSLEDLWAFNEEPVARAIARSPVPVISAVGHETDTTIADLVADLRAATPSAAAEAAVPDREAVLELLEKLRPRLGRSLRTGVERKAGRVREGRMRLVRAVERTLLPPRRDLDRAMDRMGYALERSIRSRRERLGTLAGTLHALSPLETLGRGYAVPLDGAGRLLGRLEDFHPGANFRLRVVDGTVRARVEGVEREGDPSQGSADAKGA